MVTTCYICGCRLTDDQRALGIERIALSIKPRGLKTRYYCTRCWQDQAEHGAYVKGGLKNGEGKC